MFTPVTKLPVKHSLRQVLDVMGLEAQVEDPDFKMRSLDAIMGGCTMFWLEDSGKGTMSEKCNGDRSIH